MALFSKKKNTVDTAAPKVETVKGTAKGTARSTTNFASSVLKKPRITEKASLLAESQNVYVFEVTREANKDTIRKAILDEYKVAPVKVAIVQTPSKNVFSRGKRGVQSGGKKAYIYLKKGDKIEVI